MYDIGSKKTTLRRRLLLDWFVVEQQALVSQAVKVA